VQPPEPDADPDPAPSAGRARVAGFDELGAAIPYPRDGSGERRVTRFDGLDERADAATRVAGFDGLDDRAGAMPRVAGFDGVDTARSDSAAVARFGGDTGPTGPERAGTARSTRTADLQTLMEEPATRAGRVGSTGSRRRPDPTPSDPSPSDPSPSDPSPSDPSPSDPEGSAADAARPGAPLPRGRRRGARTRRLGPDAPDPDRPQPDADPVAVAREICLRLLTDRARTRQELAQVLARKGVPDEAAAAVLDRFDEVGLIDDAAFAGQWVRSRHGHRGLGRRAIAVELRRKGVADDIAGEALAEVDAESEDRRARELVDRKLRSVTLTTSEQRATTGRRLVGMLARKGYGAGTAYRVVREALAPHGAEADELGAVDPVDG
jgi:regulatory protein